MKLCYKCYYDGRKCERAVPKFDEDGNLIPEPNQQIKEKTNKAGQKIQKMQNVNFVIQH